MLFVMFSLRRERYVLDAGQIVEVLPLVEIRSIPQAPRGVAGVFDYRGVAVPVVDLGVLALGTPTPRRISTRIIVVRPSDAHGVQRLLGVIAEKATDVLRRDTAEFVDPGIHSSAAPYLGRVAQAPGGGLMQWIQAHRLLPPAVLEALYDDGSVS